MNMHEDGYVVSTKGMSAEQLAHIEEQALVRYKRMRTVTTHIGNITLAVAALLIEIVEEAHQGNTTLVFIVAQDDDMRAIMKSYLRRYTLSRAFPYKNGQLLDYIAYADFTRIAACIG